MRRALLLLSCCFSLIASAQTLGGNTVFNFLKLPNTPQLTALGGINVSQPSNDVGMVFNNPALLQPSMHSQMNAVFNDFYAGITAYHLGLAYRHEKINTNFAWGLHYFNYGQTQQTDAAGNLLGEFRPTDWVMQVSASRSYLEKWNYGATLKFIHSNYGQYRSSGIAVDVGVLYHDTANLFSASLVAKNMGAQLNPYNGTDPGDLPFDLQAGITQRLAKAPFSFSITAHHLHQYDLRYNDTVFNNDTQLDDGRKNKNGIGNFFSHFVFATTVYLGDRVEVQAAYNTLRRQELRIGDAGNGLNGFSLGMAVFLNKLHIRYARAHYQNNTGYNQLGLNLKLNEYFGLGRWGKRIGW
ncbi:MAG TPA: type IX secretion system protein PorQ [Chitinophagaceae bacterium]|jgi:hypothetical protein|nr:type IX secretion system protein PorQ [Chitinophagaceae bacterium]